MQLTNTIWKDEYNTDLCSSDSDNSNENVNNNKSNYDIQNVNSSVNIDLHSCGQPQRLVEQNILRENPESTSYDKCSISKGSPTSVWRRLLQISEEVTNFFLREFRRNGCIVILMCKKC